MNLVALEPEKGAWAIALLRPDVCQSQIAATVYVLERAGAPFSAETIAAQWRGLVRCFCGIPIASSIEPIANDTDSIYDPQVLAQFRAHDPAFAEELLVELDQVRRQFEEYRQSLAAPEPRRSSTRWRFTKRRIARTAAGPGDGRRRGKHRQRV
jgi:hypothetical protein